MALQVSEPQSRHWTLAEYYQLAEEGWFRGQRVQLIEGEIIQMPPQGHAHAKSLMHISRWLHDMFKKDDLVRIQMPLNAMEDSDPEPDAAIIRGPMDQYHDHPQSALLAIEVADSSLRLDRRKAKIYAAAGVQEYWIVNLSDRCVEIHREPQVDKQSKTGFAYQSRTIAGESEMISPILLASAQVKVAELLP